MSTEETETQEEPKVEDLEEPTIDADTPPEEVIEEEIVDTPTYLRNLLEQGPRGGSPIESPGGISQK